MKRKVTLRLCTTTDEVADSFYAAIPLMKQQGITLCEIRGILNTNVLLLDEDDAKLCYDMLKLNGIRVWAISSPIGKTDPDISDEEYMKQVYAAINAAKLFHTDLIRIFSFFNAYDKRNEVIRKIKMCVNACNKEYIRVSVENEKLSYGDTPERINDLLVNIPGLLHTYDTGNYEQTGVPSNHCLETIFNKGYYIHFKDGFHKDGDAEITPVGQGNVNIPLLLSMISRDSVLSLEHHLRFVNREKNEKYNDIKNEAKFVYHDTTEAFLDSVKYAKKVLAEAGYVEEETNHFVRYIEDK